MKLETLQELYVEELRDLYSAENQILKALPKMAENATFDDLRSGFEKHYDQTREHVARLEQIFDELGESPKGNACEGMEGLLKEGDKMMKTDAEPVVRDAAMIAAAQRMEHYEMAGYGVCRSYAQLLGFNGAAKLLQQTLNEEKETDQKLTELALGHINADANAGTKYTGARAA